ncbi:MAG TPA: hypothetical protein VES20_21495 [Bryobacteraceae bacterium]|nr:hypothetical protein [Bryobacteraceae bacterium]
MNNESNWARLLAYVTGLVNQELLLQNEYLAAENRILRSHLPSRLRLSDPERDTLAEIGKRIERKALAQVACAARPRLVPPIDRREVRRIEASLVPRSTTHLAGRRSACGEVRTRELRLGL